MECLLIPLDRMRYVKQRAWNCCAVFDAGVGYFVPLGRIIVLGGLEGD
jgi:hypothetical protein